MILAAVALALQTLDGRIVDAFAGPQRAAAFVFVHPDCPLANRYVPELNRLHDEFASRRVPLWIVYPGREHDRNTIAAHYAEYRLRPPALLDPDYELADLAGASMTPEAAVFAPDRRLVYRGRIDDRAMQLGVWRPSSGERHLFTVMNRLANGEPVAPFTNAAVGCYIRP